MKRLSAFLHAGKDMKGGEKFPAPAFAPYSAPAGRRAGRFPLLFLSAAVLLLLLSICAAVSLGSSGGLPFLDYLAGRADPSAALIIEKIRLPRVFLAALTGAALALAGLIFQTLFQNPLAEPYILGISGGAALGVVTGVLCGISFAGGGIPAFLGGAGATVFVLLFGLRHSASSLLLAGVMLNAFFGALILFLVSFANPQEISSFFHWYMGNLGAADGRTAIRAAALLLPCFFCLLFCGHALNLLLLGRENAAALGLPAKAASLLLLAAASYMVSATIGTCGPIGFVGLVTPQLLRLLLGQDHRLLIPACILCGASFLIVCDTLARTLPPQGEIPVGAVTALVGAPVFVALLWKSHAD